jgi:hypothetical protein
MILTKSRVGVENSVIMGICDRSYFQDIFMERRPKEYLEELKEIWN